MSIRSQWASAVFAGALIAYPVPSISDTVTDPVESLSNSCEFLKVCVPSDKPQAKAKARVRLMANLSSKDTIFLSAQTVLDGGDIKELVHQITGGESLADLDIIYEEVVNHGRKETCAKVKGSGC